MLATMHRSAPSFTLLVAAATCSSFFFLVMITHAQQQQHQPVAAHHATNKTCLPRERDALLAFKAGITRDPNGALASWKEEGDRDCCQWNGVLCSNHTGHVLNLQLGSNSLVGEISHSLLSLENLEHLDISGNSLNGSSGGSIPEFLGSFKNLNYLDLSSMTFSGRVPSHLGNLTNLKYLDLSDSNGHTNSRDLLWLKHLHFLWYLDLSGVNLSTAADWPQAVNMIPSLRVLKLSGCSLTSANQSLPHLNLTKLETLDLTFNYFNHPIASCWFWNITHLKQLSLESAGLYGPLPCALDRMIYLQVLHISEYFDGNPNKLCITMTSMRNLCNLETLYIRNLLCGDIAELLESLPQCSFSKLLEVDLEENYISGVLPINWTWPVTSLESLDLFGNNIGGVLPNWMGQLTSLDFLVLRNNNISGVLPEYMGQLTSLGYLDMAQNNIGGVIPNSMSKLTSLGYLDLSQNNITGPLPSFVGHFTSLGYLDLSYNHLIGHVPHEIGMLSNLEYLNLENNDLDGNITEDHFSSLKSLQWIFLSSNSLKIEISSEWKPPFRLQGAHFASCRMGPLFPSWLKWVVSINQLDIYNTGINDHLPDWFCSTFANTRYMNISNNQIYGGLPTNMEHMLFDQLILGSNLLTGPIPPMPTSLITLDLSRNFLSGPLP